MTIRKCIKFLGLTLLFGGVCIALYKTCSDMLATYQQVSSSANLDTAAIDAQIQQSMFYTAIGLSIAGLGFAILLCGYFIKAKPTTIAPAAEAHTTNGVDITHIEI